MNKSDSGCRSRVQPLRPLRGVVGPPIAGEFEHHRIAPPALLADRIEHFWYVCWRHAASVPQTVMTLPHPCVHWTFERSGSRISGVHTRCWKRTLEPQGEVFGIKFLPAGFCAQWPQPMCTLTDAVRDAEAADALGFARALRRQLFSGALPPQGDARLAGAMELLQTRLLAGLAPADPRASAINRAVFEAAQDHSLLRAEAWAEQQGVSLRAWQRLLRQTVGVGPKWMIERFRLHHAMARLQAEPTANLSELAAELGFADLPHFSRTLRALLGLSPGALRAQRAAPPVGQPARTLGRDDAG